MTLYVDVAVLRDSADTMLRIADDFDTAASSIPDAADTGIGAPALAGILALFTGRGGELQTALASYSAALDECASEYETQDVTTAEEVNAALWEQ
ncbi:type VII secretion target [Rhodococcoides navarretei]|uniref:Type VII secretion target n=1 Tax=Rhodococcus navarretei TaxID=3128981 RepID=A0ABU9CU57_9NOCA